MGLIKNGPGHSGHGTLKQALSQEGINEITDFLNAVIIQKSLKLGQQFFEREWSQLGMVTYGIGL